MSRHTTEVWASSGDRAPRPYGAGPGDAHTSACDERFGISYVDLLNGYRRV